MKKMISLAAVIAVLGGVFTTDVAFAKTSQNHFYQHSMANRQRQAQQRDREKHQHWYEMQKQARKWQQQRNPFEEYAKNKEESRKAEPALNAPQFAQQVLSLCNAERAKAGLKPLSLSAELQSAAMVRAKELTKVFSHTRPDGSDCTTVLKSKWGAGENIAAGYDTPEKVVAGWMDSPGHRRNILYNRFDYLGVGYCYAPDGVGGYTHYWVQIFQGN